MLDRWTNSQWLQDLAAGGEIREKAIVDLRAVLMRAALYSIQRHPQAFNGMDEEELRQRAEDCAQEALLAVLEHLPDFRGDSKFIPWVYKVGCIQLWECSSQPGRLS